MEKLIKQGIERHMRNIGLLALTERHGSHEKEDLAKAEEGEFWDGVSGVPLNAEWVKKARQDDMT